MSTTVPDQAFAVTEPVLADDYITISSRIVLTILKAAGIEDVDLARTTLFAIAPKVKNSKYSLTTVSTSEFGNRNFLSLQEMARIGGNLLQDN